MSVCTKAGLSDGAGVGPKMWMEAVAYRALPFKLVTATTVTPDLRCGLRQIRGIVQTVANIRLGYLQWFGQAPVPRPAATAAPGTS